MSPLLKSRRFLLALIAISFLFVLGYKDADVANSIAMIVIGVAGANAYEAKGTTPTDKEETK